MTAFRDEPTRVGPETGRILKSKLTYRTRKQASHDSARQVGTYYLQKYTLLASVSR